MRINEAKKILPIIQAIAEGKQIQGMYLNGGYGAKYEDCDPNDTLDFDNYDYRVKPESKIRPYTFEEMKAAIKKHGDWVKGMQGYRAWSIVYFDDKVVTLSDNAEYFYEEIVEDYAWLDDNSPCGVMEE